MWASSSLGWGGYFAFFGGGPPTRVIMWWACPTLEEGRRGQPSPKLPLPQCGVHSTLYS
jgi:hypothetical protein